MTTLEDALGSRRPIGPSIRSILIVTGAIAVIVGILMLVWPGQALIAMTIVFAVYAILQGLMYAVAAIALRDVGGWARAGFILVGLLFVFAGGILLSNLDESAGFLFLFMAIFIGVTWVFEGFAAFGALGTGSERGWTIAFAILSIVAGFLLFLLPITGGLTLWIVAGIALIVTGIAQVLRGIFIKSLGGPA